VNPVVGDEEEERPFIGSVSDDGTKRSVQD